MKHHLSKNGIEAAREGREQRVPRRRDEGSGSTPTSQPGGDKGRYVTKHREGAAAEAGAVLNCDPPSPMDPKA